MFPIAGVGLGVSIHDDEAAAIESPWPRSSGPRPLPVEILQRLTRAADVLPIRGGAPSEAADLDPLASIEDDSFFDGSIPARAGSRVRGLAARAGRCRQRPLDRHLRSEIRDRPRSKLSPAARLGHGEQASFRDRAARRPDLRPRPGQHQRHHRRRPHSARRRDRNPRRRSHPDRPGRLHAGRRPRQSRRRPGRENDRRLAARRRQRLPSLSRRKPADDLVPDDRRPRARRPSPKTASSTKSSRTSW